MKKIFLLIIILISFYSVQKQLIEDKPKWFLKALTKIPFTNTTVEIDFRQKPDWDEEELHMQFPGLLLDCYKETSKLGDRVCWTYISRFHNLPAESAAFFFKKDKFQFLRVEFDSNEYSTLKSWLDNNFKYQGDSSADKRLPAGLGIWNTKGGVLATYKVKPVNQKTILLTWLKT